MNQNTLDINTTPHDPGHATKPCTRCGSATEIAICAGNLIEVCTKCGKRVCIN